MKLITTWFESEHYRWCLGEWFRYIESPYWRRELMSHLEDCEDPYSPVMERDNEILYLPCCDIIMFDSCPVESPPIEPVWSQMHMNNQELLMHPIEYARRRIMGGANYAR